MYNIQIKIQFRAGHRLVYPYVGACNGVHGEGYTAIVVLSSEELDQNGMVVDFKVAKNKIREWINENWDHAYIHSKDDEIGEYLKSKGLKTYKLQTNPTAEELAKYLFDVIKSPQINLDVERVGIVESFDDSIAWYSR